MTIERDVPYARHGAQELLARLYLPETRGPWPVMVEVHGGGWSSSDRLQGVLRSRAAASAGAAVVALDFRQGPAHHHPAASEDVSAGIRWVRARTDLGFDPSRVAIMGSSSGGHLALYAAVTPGLPSRALTPIVLADGRLERVPRDETVRFVVALWPAADPLAARVVETRGYFAGEREMGEVSIAAMVRDGRTRALPPVWLVEAERDEKIPASTQTELVAAYRAAGGDIEHLVVRGAAHGFGLRPGGDTDRLNELVRTQVAARF